MNAILIHSTGGSPDETFFPWLKKTLEQEGWKVSVPFLPSSEIPDRERWIQAVSEVYEPHEKTVLIGRSLGGTLIPYLFERGLKAEAAYLIAAPWNDLGWENIKKFFQKSPDFQKIPKCHIELWYSDNDPHVPLEHGKRFQEVLGGKLRIFPGMSHFYQTEFPELSERIRETIDLERED